jgi:hypothetical protein
VAVLSDLLSKVRLELGDNATQFTTNLTGTGSIKDFYLDVKPVDATYLVVTVNGVAQANPTNFTVEENLGVIHFNSASTTKTGSGGGAGTSSFTVNNTTGIVVGMSITGTGIATTAMVSSITGSTIVNVSVVNTGAVSGTVTFTQIPKNGAPIVVSGVHYRYFTSAELTTFLNTAVLQHTDNRTDSYGSNITIASIPPVEEYPVAILATVEALWALATDAAFDINITAPDGVVIPRNQRFAQLSMIIQARKEQYRELCAALNVGLWRIEMGILRRISRTTNKLVPVYMPQEIDDRTKPERVYIENNMKGRTPPPSNVGVYDIILTQGDTWSTTFDFPLNLTDYLVKAQIRTYPESPVLSAEFTVTTVTATTGVVTLSLTSDQTEDLPLKSFWDVQVYKADGSFNQTYVRGLVFANRAVTDENNVVSTPLAAPTFIASTPPAGTRTVAYSYQFLATGPDPLFYVQTGTLPTGLSLGSTGLLSGIPTTAGTYNFTIRVYNSGLVFTTAQSTLPLSTLFTDLAVSVVIS